MPCLTNKKGFYAVTPLIGTLMFMIAAGAGLLIINESHTQVDLASASDIQGRLQFISEAILTDSFNNLIQLELERITIGFLESGDVVIDPDVDWRANLKDPLERKIKSDMGRALGIDLEAYSSAYRSLPGMGGCEVLRKGETYMFPTVSPYTQEDDGTIINRVFSFGEQINCTSIDPPGETVVDIYGKYYHMNVRMISMFEMAQDAMKTAENVIRGAATEVVSAAEILAEMMTPQRWKRVIGDTDNKIAPPAEDSDMQDLLTDWATKSGFMEGRIRSYIGERFGSSENIGLKLAGLGTEGLTGDLALDEFDVICYGDEFSKNCASEQIELVLGDPGCGDKGGMLLLGSPGAPFFEVEVETTGLTGELLQETKRLAEERFRPLGYACINFHATVMAGGYGVCKEWRGRPNSVIFTGTVTDDNPKYNPTTKDEVTFNMKSERIQFPPLEEELQCRQPGLGQDRFKGYLERMMSYLELVVTHDSVRNSWKDIRSRFIETSMDPRDEWIFDIYRDTSSDNKLPVVDFDYADSNVLSAVQQGAGRKWTINVDIVWDAFMDICTDVDFNKRFCLPYCEAKYGPVSYVTQPAGNTINWCTALGKFGAARGENALECHCREGLATVESPGTTIKLSRP